MPSPTRRQEPPSGPSVAEHLAARAAERTVAKRRPGYEQDVTRIVEGTFELIRRTGRVDPSMRDILAETGLSTQAFYRYFTSKDELMLALLDEGRRRLVGTLERRMGRRVAPADQVRAWIEGVVAQASDAAAARTRPWVASEQRLSELFPEEQQASVDVLLGLVQGPIRRMRGGTDGAARACALLVYRLTFATLQAHLARGTRPTAAETAALVDFCVRGVSP
jgi:AcrR family transcriptional regulator